MVFGMVHVRGNNRHAWLDALAPEPTTFLVFMRSGHKMGSEVA